MSIVYLDDFETPLAADLTIGATQLTLPSGAVSAIEAALVADTGYSQNLPGIHFVPLVVDNGSAIELVQVFSKASATTVNVTRGAVPIAAVTGNTVRCSVPAPLANGPMLLPRKITDYQVSLAPGCHVITDDTSASLTAVLYGLDENDPSISILPDMHLPSIMEIHNTSGTARTVSVLTQGPAPTMLWAGGTPQLSIGAGVKVAVYEFRIITPAAERTALSASVLAKADFYS